MPRVKLEFSDEVTAELTKLGAKAPQILDSALFMVSCAGKRAIKSKMRTVLNSRTGKMMKSFSFDKKGTGYYKIKAPNLASVYENKGADIFPKNKKVLRWKNEKGEWMSSNWVRLERKPFFASSLREFVSSGEINRVAQDAIDKEIVKVGIDL
jgi:hypothetical protein